MFDQELQDFFRFLQTEKRYSPHTLSNYQRDIQGFIGFCRQQELSWLSIDNQHVRSYIAQVHRKGLSGKSIQRLLSSLRSLFRFLLKWAVSIPFSYYRMRWRKIPHTWHKPIRRHSHWGPVSSAPTLVCCSPLKGSLLTLFCSR